MFDSAIGNPLDCLAIHQLYDQTNFERALNMKDTRSLFQGYQQLTSYVQTAKEE